MVKKGLNTNEQAIVGVMLMGAGLFYQLNKTVSGHMEDCARRSATVEKIGYGILVIVAAGLILSGINSYHNSGTTMQRIETVEEKHTTK